MAHAAVILFKCIIFSFIQCITKAVALYCLHSPSKPLPGLHYNFLVSSDLICCLVFAVNQCGGGSGGDECTLSQRYTPLLPSHCAHILLSNGPYGNRTHPPVFHHFLHEYREPVFLSHLFSSAPGDANSRNKLYVSA